MDETCSTLDAARRLGVSVQTVQRWVDLGRLRAWKTLGGHRRVDLKSVEALMASRHEALTPPAGAGGRALPGARVLVVDDDAAGRELLAALVTHALPAAKVSQVASGFEALIALGLETPDILITDLMMPGMDGIEMLCSIAGAGVARPASIVAVSSHTLDELAARGRLPDGVSFLPKPVEPDALAACLRQADATRLQG